MKKALLYLSCSFLLIFIATTSQAQQLPLFSQYRINGFVLNPAMTGADGLQAAMLTYRRQWTEIPNGPKTASASYTAYLDHKKVGIGGYIIHDQTGPTSLTGINFNYSYHLDLGYHGTFDINRLAFGFTFSFLQYRLDGSKLILFDPIDDLVHSDDRSRLLPDAGLGLYYYNDYMYGGISIPQVISLNVKFHGDGGVAAIRRLAHFYATGGGFIKFGEYENHVFEPSVWIKYTPHSPIHADFNVRTTLDNKFIFGVGYSTSRIASAELGFIAAERFRMNYAVSANLSRLQVYQGFTHELMLTYIISNEGWY